MFESLFPIVFGVIFALAFVFILLTFVRIIMAQRKMRAMGIDPMTAAPEMIHNISEAAARAAQSPEDRLRELDRLRGEGLITGDEYDAKRSEIIKDL